MLRIFVAAARHGSLSAAARELAIGQPAVSHAVTKLEHALGATVFIRSHGGVSLTGVGEQLYETASRSYGAIDRAVQDIQRQRADETVTLSVSSSLASFWLMPRLPSFKRQHPDVDLRVLTTDGDSGVGRDDADLWIPLGQVDSPGLTSVEFCVERVVPVATPAVAAALGSWSTQSELADALAEAPLLTLLERYVTRFDWGRWFGAVNRKTPANLTGYASNDYSLVLQAALDGQGVALGWVHIVADLVDAGRLVALGEAVETDAPFHLFTRADAPSTDAAAALSTWLQTEMSAQMTLT